jgi:hypothetical protein
MALSISSNEMRRSVSTIFSTNTSSMAKNRSSWKLSQAHLDQFMIETPNSTNVSSAEHETDNRTQPDEAPVTATEPETTTHPTYSPSQHATPTPRATSPTQAASDEARTPIAQNESSLPSLLYEEHFYERSTPLYKLFTVAAAPLQDSPETFATANEPDAILSVCSENKLDPLSSCHATIVSMFQLVASSCQCTQEQKTDYLEFSSF